MKSLTLSFSRLRWLNVPGALLLTLLQRTPAVRVASVAGEMVTASPLGQVLRSAAAVAGSLGALHSLAGATQLTASTASPLRATVGAAIPTVAMTVTGAQTPPGSFRVTGPIPPGIAISGLTGSGGSVNGATLAMTGTPTTAGTYAITIRAWEKANNTGDSSSNFTYTVSVAGAAGGVAPAFTTQPASQTVTAGAMVTFTAIASGTPAPGYQWLKNGANVASATNASLTLAAVQAADAGTYTVVATNSAGTATSSPATLAVSALPAGSTLPAIAAAPVAETIAAGSTVVFSVAATGTPAPAYQWSKDGVALTGATSATLIVNSAGAAAAGAYAVAVANAAGTVTSAPAALNVVNVDPTSVGRLVNLSILTTAGSGAKALTIGATIGGGTTTDTLPLVIRAIGPTLASAFGLTGVLGDPVLALNAAGNSTPLAVNDNWGGGTGMMTAFANVAAFALPSSSLDAAIVRTNPGLAAGGYTMQVTSQDGVSSGTVLAELYDAVGGSRVASTPRLTNLSTLTQIDAGASLAVGFVIGGTTARTLLVRGVGPTLGSAFGLGGTMTDPKLELFDNSTGRKITDNNDWGGDSALATAQASVGAFALASASSKDAVLLVTLAPGQYSARVSGADGGGGTAIVEVYEVP